MGNRTFLTALAISVLLALVVSTIFYQMTSHAGTQRIDQRDLRDIVLAAKPLNAGAILTLSDLKLGKTPGAAFPRDAFGTTGEVVDRAVIQSILVDDPILEGRLASRSSGVGAAPSIPIGMRAVSVRVSDVGGLSGFVLPGMRVDVLVTGRPPESNGVVTTTCLQNTLVLSTGNTMQPDALGRSMQAATVTLLASPEQAETLTLASSEGHIQLVLRNGSDQKIEKTPGRELSEVYGRHGNALKRGSPAMLLPRPRPQQHWMLVKPDQPPMSPPLTQVPLDQVIVIRGTRKTVENVEKRH